MLKIILKLKLFLVIVLYTIIVPVIQKPQWPKFQHDNRNTGQSTYIASAPSTVKWTYYIGRDQLVISSPAISPDGTIYIGSGHGTLYAIKPNGTLKWESDAIISPGSSLGSPTIGPDGTIYVPSDEYLCAFNPDGTLKWKYDTKIYGKKVVVRINIYGFISIGSDGTLYSRGGYEPATDGSEYPASEYREYFCALNPDGTLKWKYIGKNILDSHAIGSNNTIYVVSNDHEGTEGGKLLAIDPNGALKWEYQAETSNDFGCPAIGSDGTIYISSVRNLHAISADGTFKWKYATNDIITSPQAIGNDDTVYFGTTGGFLFAINPNGSLKWKYDTQRRSSISTSPVIGRDSSIHVTNFDGVLFVLNRNGTLKSEYDSQKRMIWTSPAIGSGGTLYFVGENVTHPGSPNDFVLYAMGHLHVQAYPEKKTHNNPIQVNLTMDAPGTIYWKSKPIRGTGRSRWQKYTSPINISVTTTLQFYAENAFGNKTEIQEKTYEIVP